MHITLNKFNWWNCLIYLDDIIVFRISYYHHTKDVKEILTVLKSVVVTVKQNKCALFKQSVDYLGHTITKGK